MDVTLRCTAGPPAGETITVDSELMFGRELPEPGRCGGDPRLSRRHARVFIGGSEQAMVEDLGSTNGTWVNDERLTEARILANGDRLRVGQTSFDVDVPERPALTTVDTGPAIASPTLPDAPASLSRLRAIAGPLAGTEITLGDELLIGRSYGEPGALGGDRRLSRRHARIARGPGGVFFIHDTGSTNGTSVNHEPVRGAHALKDGDEIEVGSSALVTRDVPGAPLTPELVDEPPAGIAAPAAEAAPAAPSREDAGGHAPRPFQPQGAAGTRLSSRRVLGVFGGVFAAAAIVSVAAVLITAPLGSRGCPQGFVCQNPPTAPPLHASSTFTGALGWRAEYDPHTATPSKADVKGNQLLLHESNAEDKNWGASPASNVIAVLVHAYPTTQYSAQVAMQNLANGIESELVGATTAPNSDQMFGSPVLGFHPARGEVVEGSARTPQGPGGLLKAAILSASSGGVTIAAAVVYPVQQGQSQQTNPDQLLDQFGDQVLNTIRFPSDGNA